MTQVAIIAYPGQKIESSLLREIQAANLKTRVFREFDDLVQLARSKSFVIAGTPNDSLDYNSAPIMAKHELSELILREAKKGKPVLGIGYGAIILAELGLVPGEEGLKQSLAVTDNMNFRNEHLMDPAASYVHQDISLAVSPKRTPFTLLLGNKPVSLPLSGPHSRFVSFDPELGQKLSENKQVIFKYEADKDISSSLENAAAISNSQGNVLAILSNFERDLSEDKLQIFASLKKFLEEPNTAKEFPNIESAYLNFDLEDFVAEGESIILEENPKAIQRLSKFISKFLAQKITIKRYAHYDLLKADLAELRATEALITPNTIKEVTNLQIPSGALALLVRNIDDLKGQLLTEELAIDHHLPVASIHASTLWVVEGLSPESTSKLLDSNLLFNPNYQKAYLYTYNPNS